MAGKAKKRSKPNGKKGDLVGVAESAEILGIRKQNLYRLRDNGELPDPRVELASGPVWDRKAMEECAKERRKAKAKT